jgi:hypothetical protein
MSSTPRAPASRLAKHEPKYRLDSFAYMPTFSKPYLADLVSIDGESQGVSATSQEASSFFERMKTFTGQFFRNEKHLTMADLCKTDGLRLLGTWTLWSVRIQVINESEVTGSEDLLYVITVVHAIANTRSTNTFVKQLSETDYRHLLL